MMNYYLVWMCSSPWIYQINVQNEGTEYKGDNTTTYQSSIV